MTQMIMTHGRLELGTGETGMFGYGSLLLKSSLERTLQRPYVAEPVACSIRGWRRTWNSLFPNDRFFYLAGDQRRYPKHIVYLNITRAGSALNGVLYVIGEDDLAAFDRREAVYERVDVRGDLVDVEVTGGPVWAYVGKPAFLLRSAAPVEEAAIRRTYIDIVESGLASLGPAFRDAYLASTDVPPAENVIDDRLD